jgi:probable rRNA maturation factor
MNKKSIRYLFTLDIFNKTRRPIPDQPFLKLLRPARTILQKATRISSHKKYRLELTFVGMKTITSLNAMYHHKNRPTDVIALSYYDKKMYDAFVGEIFICVPFAFKQAKKIGQSLTEELRFLFVHGLLHCFGYDHQKPKEEARMQNLTYRILGRM